MLPSSTLVYIVPHVRMFGVLSVLSGKNCDPGNVDAAVSTLTVQRTVAHNHSK